MSATEHAATTMVKDFTLEQISDGQSAALERLLTDADIDAFAALSGDVSPIHIDEAYARAQGLPGRVVHGTLLVALVSRLVGTELPGAPRIAVEPAHGVRSAVVRGRHRAGGRDVSGVHAAMQVIQLRITIRCGAELRAQGSALVKVRAEPA